ncbi:MAG: 2Fe-2S iron-sulfur cluster-binding protein, partial [Pseudomonadota bacterium]
MSLSDSSVDDTVSFSLNGREVSAGPGESILQVARREEIEIPHLCYADGLAAAGNCRACMVEIDGERVLAPSCCRTPVEGMRVVSNSARAKSSQSLILELLRGEVGESSHTQASELDEWC